MNHGYLGRQPYGHHFIKKQPFITDSNVMNPGMDSEHNFNSSNSRSRGGQVPRRQSSNNMMQMNMEQRSSTGQSITQKRERRSKKYFDRQHNPSEVDDYLNPINSELLERRSGSNNRIGLNEDKGTEKSNKDSVLFPFQEEDDNNSLNKDSAQDNELRPINYNMPENEPDLGEDINKISSRDFSRQDSNKFLNYENQTGMDSFGQNTFQFRDTLMNDYGDSKFSQQFNPQMNMGWNSNFTSGNDLRSFQMNQMQRMPQSNFNDPFTNTNRNMGFNQDFSNNVMNPNNQFSEQMRGQMNFFNETPGRRNNSFAGPKR